VNEVSSNTLQQDSLYKFGSNLLCVFIIQLQHHFGSCIIYIFKGHNSTNSFKKNLVFELPSPYIIDLHFNVIVNLHMLKKNTLLSYIGVYKWLT
jgi:hypothetical protein